MTNSTKIKNILKKYNLDSVAKSVYTIVSWQGNRNYLGYFDLLNKSFLDIKSEQFGREEIRNYEEFRGFYENILDLLKTEITFSAPEPFPIDNGEVKFLSDDQFYKIFIGNGSENTYETCFIIDAIVSQNNKYKLIWDEILGYEDKLLSLMNINNKPQSVEVSCPPKDYYKKIFLNYDSLKNLKLEKYFSKFDSENKELYSFFRKDNGYPVYLPMFKECFMEIIEQEIETKEFQEYIWTGVFRKINSNFFSKQKSSHAILNSLQLINQKSNELTELYKTIAIIVKDRIIFFSDNEDYNNLQAIKKKTRGNHYRVIGQSITGEKIEVKIHMFEEIILQQINTQEVSPNISNLSMLAHFEEPDIEINDLFGIINFADSLDRIIEFIIYFKSDEEAGKMMNFSGITSLFQIWRDEEGIIQEGALEASLVIPTYQSVYKTQEFFSKELINYPFLAGGIFENIHQWNIKKNQEVYSALISKNLSASADIFTIKEKKMIYLEWASIIDNLDKETLESFSSYNEVMINTLNGSKETLLTELDVDVLEINIVSDRVLKEEDIDNKIIKNNYCDKLIINTTNKQTLLISPNWNSIHKNNLECQTKKFENDLLLDFIEGLKFNDYDNVYHQIRATDYLQRTAGVGQVEIFYYINPQSHFSPPPNTSFKKARRTIAHTIKRLDIETRSYTEKESLDIIKHFRNDLRLELIEMIVKYNWRELHNILVDRYSSLLFDKDIHEKRLMKFKDMNNVQERIKEKFIEEARDLREEAKKYKIVLEYLIEENLIAHRTKEPIEVKEESIEVIIAYAKWMIDFQSVSDAVNYGATGWHNVDIRDDFVVEINETAKYLEDAEKLKNLRYNYRDYFNRDTAYDIQMLDQVNQQFKLDTGISIKSLYQVLEVISSHSVINQYKQEAKIKVYGNMVVSPISLLAEASIKYSDVQLEEFYSVLSFINLNVAKVANEDGVIPIWEKKKRKNKFTAQPLLIEKDQVIYSPVTVNELKEEWSQGILNFILPYDEGLNNTIKLLADWKRNYEEKIVKDVAKLFGNENYLVYIDKELYKLDKKGKHPRNLGDYDLIVIDKKYKEILLFEIKYIGLSQTMKDSLRDQARYYTGTKAKADKFERRMNYFIEKKEEIFKNLNLHEDYKIKSYFLTNKVMPSYFREFNFEIISFNEFKREYPSISTVEESNLEDKFD